ncbi:MAG: sugar transferase [Synergistaceae bacterium]|nr:sugar transferase [Synergistaceae bacterium]
MTLERKLGFYEKYTKRILDIICSTLAIIVFSWLYVIIAILVRLKLGSPIIFKQPRPGLIDPKTGQERIFYMYKFRTMTDEKDETGKLKPDTERLTPFGKKLRGTSLDELPEVFNILKGDMSIIGPRPQLVRDMVFMSDEQRMRHTARPGLSGLAQVMGRNAISWEDKLAWDLEYIKHVSFWNDLKLILLTAKKVFGREESSENVDLTDDYGDALLKAGKVSSEKYEALQIQAQQLLAGC